MKISYCSDLHLEFNSIVLDNTDNSDILVLAGDILPYSFLEKFFDFFQNISNQWSDVIIVLGNHDHYKGNFLKTLNKYKNFVSELNNITILNNEYLEIQDVRFIGATLWTNYFNNNPIIKEQARLYMNDYKYIYHNGYRRFNPEDALKEFYKSYDYIRSKLDHNKIVLITHQAPSLQSIPEMYKMDDLSGAYASDLDHLFFENPQIKIAIHGHVHTKFNYKINQTNILCNPRGYSPSEKISKSFKLDVIDI